MKVIQLNAEMEGVDDLKLFILPNILTPIHFVVIEDRLINLIDKQPFYIIRIITHSKGFNNLKFKKEFPLLSGLSDLTD